MTEVWLALISGIVTLGGSLLLLLRYRETNRVADLTERVRLLEQEGQAHMKLIASLQRQNYLLREENASLVRLLAKHEQAGRESLIVTDELGVVVEWDAAAVLMFGYSAVEAVGRDVSALIVPVELRQGHRYALANVFKNKRQPRTVPIKAVAINRASERFDVEVQLLPGWETGDQTGAWRYGARIRKLVLPTPSAVPHEELPGGRP